MPSVKDSLSFGQYLQALRLDKKISLKKVSAETRIGLSMLKLIEKEHHDKLPDEVFVKGKDKKVKIYFYPRIIEEN